MKKMTQRSWCFLALVGSLATGCSKGDKDAPVASSGPAAAATSAAASSSPPPASASSFAAVATPKIEPGALADMMAKAPIAAGEGEVVGEAKDSSLFALALEAAPAADAASGQGGAPPAAAALDLVQASAFSDATERAPSADPTAQGSKPFVSFRKVGVDVSAGHIGVSAAGLDITGAGQYLVKVVVTDDANQPITESAPKQYTLRSERGATAGVEFGLDPASGGLEKVKGRVVFYLAASQVQGDKAVLVNYLPFASVDVRYGRVVGGGQTYASMVNGRTFSARAALTNGAWLVNVASFTYDSQNDCLFTAFAEGQTVGGRVDEYVEYQGCSVIDGSQLVFDVSRVCKVALHNEPDCRKHSQSITTPFVLYPYGIGLRGLIFRE